MTRTSLFSVSVLALALCGCVGTPAAYEAAAVRAEPAHKGYLTASQLQALSDVVPPPPAADSAQYAADRALSDSYRVLENTDRWLLAASHAEVRVPFVLQHFDCTLGVRYDPASGATPATSRLMQRLFEDAEGASTLVKLRAHRPRPVGDDASRAACQTVSAAGRASPSYPSGTASVAAAFGAAMAQIAPEHAEQAIKTGQEIGFSRALCGMHYPTDVRVGLSLGEAVFAEAMKTPEFARDLEQARAEYAALKASGQTNPGCAAERAALSQSANLSL
ncbi:phosphatase PAP2 family protein [uncultured Brevundimonas sp.]|uniref:phosphatase PAP2 family protein n=1 Tax=uncultured Brevundimonas sp. TaxID=213418 RepID=UPI00261BCDE6|nr:phosphatase PAP2 family protein [uncultured Brevundimonas sp.]